LEDIIIAKPNIDEYNSIYGKYPDEQAEIIEYLKTNLEYNKDDYNTILDYATNKIQWKTIELVFYLVPKGSPRPKSDSTHFYVKGAKQLKKIFKNYIIYNNIIHTRVNYKLFTYHPTPINKMSNEEIILCEEGIIRPITSPDFDNLAKTYTDAIQGVLILNDNIINPGYIEKFYSVKPRIKIILSYQTDYDSNYNRIKTINSIAYKKYIEK